MYKRVIRREFERNITLVSGMVSGGTHVRFDNSAGFELDYFWLGGGQSPISIVSKTGLTGVFFHFCWIQWNENDSDLCTSSKLFKHFVKLRNTVKRWTITLKNVRHFITFNDVNHILSDLTNFSHILPHLMNAIHTL